MSHPFYLQTATPGLRRAADPFRICLALLLLATTARADEAAPGVRAVAFSPDGKLLAAGTGEPEQPGTVTLWDLSTRRPRWVYREKHGVPAFAFSPDGRTLAVAGYDHTARLLDAATGKEKATLRHPKEVRAVAFSPDGKRLATACWDRLLRVWDLASGMEKVTCTGHKDRIFSIAFSADGKRLLSAGGNDGAKLWDAATGAEKRTFQHGNSYYRCACFTPDGRWILTGDWGGTVRVWDAETGEMRARFSGMAGVDGLAFSPAAKSLAVCSSARHVYLYDLSLGEPEPSERERIVRLLTQLDDNSYDVREATTRELLEAGFVAEPALRRAMAESKSAEVRIRARRILQDLLSQPRALLRGHTAAVEALAFSPDGKLLVSGSKDGTVRLWNVPDRKELTHLAPPR
jgi:WD40 repeat protein